MMYNCSYKLTQVLNVPSAKSSASWRQITSRFEFHVAITVWVGISFSKQHCSPRHVSVFNLSTTMCNSTNALDAGGYFRFNDVVRRVHLAELIALQLTVQLNAWFTLASFGDFCPSNYAVFGDFVTQC